LVVVFLIALRRPANADDRGAPGVFLSFLLCAMGPIIAISALEPAPNYALRAHGASGAAHRDPRGPLGQQVHGRIHRDALREPGASQDITRQKEARQGERARSALPPRRATICASRWRRLLVETRSASPIPTRRIVKASALGDSMAALLNAILDVSRFDAER
jgi:hypothetical protein